MQQLTGQPNEQVTGTLSKGDAEYRELWYPANCLPSIVSNNLKITTHDNNILVLEH
jgi:hypothetical protein